ncbi:hypothetical protein BJ875DRAFT_452344 [Amylocarpus encephaloides]|uniref:Autophagy-related protein 29 n=1 Tax=Amylocarpus encephaloides TaxID=45428 RepID=A0A9P7YRY9_9HELO|nr:hypothetical protein BJ875DRAFT_452344 [Amylocarpus encephaloides]
MSRLEPSYTVFIRLPFPRGDFVDPPAVDWDASKDKALWKILSKTSKNSNIDWNELAAKFEVTLAFLLQQAAWLYERQLVQVRAQMRRVGASKACAAPSLVPSGTYETSRGDMMGRTNSGGGGPKGSSSLSSRKETLVPRIDAIPGTPGARTIAPSFSRTSFVNTAATARNLPQPSPRHTHAIPNRRSISPNPRPRPVSMAFEPPNHSPPQEVPSPPSSSLSSSDSELPAQSRLLRRPPRFTTKGGHSEDEDGSDDEPAFMPIAGPSRHDPSATLRGDPRNVSRRTIASHRKPNETQQSQTSDSSASSAAAPMRPRPEVISREGLQRQRLAGPLSSPRTVELAGRSTISRGRGREGSDETPSMGSSFSDLDDASVTQSALEEAFASNMQAGGGMTSRMSTISQALRSRYL